MKTTKNHRRAFFGLALLGFVGSLALPSIGSATPPTSNEPAPVEAGDCDPKSAINLEIDVMTGDVYMVDASGGLELTNGEIDVYVGTNARLLVDLQYSTGEWAVEISPSGGTTTTRNTRGSGLRYWMDTAPDEYLFSSTMLSAMMTPVVPDIIIRPKPDCPPSP